MIVNLEQPRRPRGLRFFHCLAGFGVSTRSSDYQPDGFEKAPLPSWMAWCLNSSNSSLENRFRSQRDSVNQLDLSFLC
jgi:hypothetical protein